MARLAPEAIPPVRLKDIVPGSITLERNPAKPNEMIFKAQVSLEPSPDLFTLVLHLARADLLRLIGRLKDERHSEAQKLTPA